MAFSCKGVEKEEDPEVLRKFFREKKCFYALGKNPALPDDIFAKMADNLTGPKLFQYLAINPTLVLRMDFDQKKTTAMIREWLVADYPDVFTRWGHTIVEKKWPVAQDFRFFGVYLRWIFALRALRVALEDVGSAEVAQVDWLLSKSSEVEPVCRKIDSYGFNIKDCKVIIRTARYTFQDSLVIGFLDDHDHIIYKNYDDDIFGYILEEVGLIIRHLGFDYANPDVRLMRAMSRGMAPGVSDSKMLQSGLWFFSPYIPEDLKR